MEVIRMSDRPHIRSCSWFTSVLVFFFLCRSTEVQWTGSEGAVLTQLPSDPTATASLLVRLVGTTPVLGFAFFVKDGGTWVAEALKYSLCFHMLGDATHTFYPGHFQGPVAICHLCLQEWNTEASKWTIWLYAWDPQLGEWSSQNFHERSKLRPAGGDQGLDHLQKYFLAVCVSSSGLGPSETHEKLSMRKMCDSSNEKQGEKLFLLWRHSALLVRPSSWLAKNRRQGNMSLSVRSRLVDTRRCALFEFSLVTQSRADSNCLRSRRWSVQECMERLSLPKADQVRLSQLQLVAKKTICSEGRHTKDVVSISYSVQETLPKCLKLHSAKYSKTCLKRPPV